MGVIASIEFSPRENFRICIFTHPSTSNRIVSQVYQHIMTELRPLRGGCQCGRNCYIIAIPQDGFNRCQVHFNTEPEHQIPLATPLAAYIRVPLEWYHSTTNSFFPDETHALIRRVYTHPTQSHAKRQFCGYCGTPLSYWSEKPSTEADFINLTIGSLLREDLGDLEDMGLIPGTPEETETQEGKKTEDETSDVERLDTRNVLRESYGVPWFDSLVEGTRLGNMRTNRGIERSHDGRVKIEWEVREYHDDGDEDTDMSTTGAVAGGVPSKRKHSDAGAAGTRPAA